LTIYNLYDILYTNAKGYIVLKLPISEVSISRATRSLTEWTTEILRRAILDGYFEPGERLDQDAIAEELGVSLTPLRGAIAALESEGLFVRWPHRGVFLREVSEEELRESFALRALLEAELVLQATSSIPDSVLDELESMLEKADNAYDDGDHAAFFDADRHLHKTLAEFAGASLWSEVLELVKNRIAAVVLLAHADSSPYVGEFSREHFAILEAMRERDPKRAAALMRQHLDPQRAARWIISGAESSTRSKDQ
jgi:DNA-binding GntR family transcriptional regulator